MFILSCPSPLLLILFCICPVSSWHEVARTDEQSAFYKLDREKTSIHRRKFMRNRSAIPQPEGHNSTACPAHCLRTAANGVCDADCDVDACLRDLGDCKTSRVCSQMTCPHDGTCRIRCYMAGCLPLDYCHLDTTSQRQYIIANLPEVHPYALVAQFAKMENDMHNKLGFYVSLQSYKDGPMIWGFAPETYKVSRLHYTDSRRQILKVEDGSAFQNRSIAVFSVDADRIITTHDIKEIDVMERLGTDKMKAVLIPMLMDLKETRTFDEEFASILRAAQNDVRRSKNHRREELPTNTPQIDADDEEIDEDED